MGLFTAASTSPLLPALFALLWRGRRPSIASRDRWDPRVDTALCLGAGLVGAAAMAWITAPWSLTQFPFAASDFADYCGSLEPILSGQLELASGARSVAAGLLPALLRPSLGVVGALAGAAFVSTALLCGALFVAGRALHSRTAGLAAVILATAMPPLAVMPRTVSFYPETVASIALAAASALAFVRFRTPTFALLAGVSTGFAMLADVRAMMFAVPAAIVAIGSVLLRPRPAPRAALFLALVLAPLALSWAIGARINADTWGLQDQTVAYAGDALRAVGVDPELVPRPKPAERFRWGVDPLANAIPGVRFLSRVSAVLAEHTHGSAEAAAVRARLGAWPTVLACAALALVLGVGRRPVLVLAAVGTLAPFLAVFYQALTTFPLPRMLATGLPAVAVIAGVGFAVLVRGGLPAACPPPEDAPPAPVRERLLVLLRVSARPGFALLGLVVMVGGAVPTWLGPLQPWRTWGLSSSEPWALLAETAAGQHRAGAYQCQTALWRDNAAGLPLIPTWYGPGPRGWEEVYAAAVPMKPPEGPPRPSSTSSTPR
ncbi:MAG: hypothetical protein V4850_26050 [Myxococcota bacterium]